MSPIESIRTCFRKYFVFSGRATRSEFWWFFLFALVSIIVVFFVPVVGWVYAIAMQIPVLAVMVRRLHDLNLSGWWALVWLIPFIDWLLLLWLAFPGTFGPNRFGPDPRQVDWWLPPPGTETGPPTPTVDADGQPSIEHQADAICSQCGAQLLDGARFCSFCGTAF